MAKGEGHGEGCGGARGRTERLAVPAMPMPLAILCCVLNFFLPGVGTIIAGFAAFCCSRNEDMSGCSRLGSCCVSFGIGLLQLLLTALILIGWIWSCVWGVFFIGMSSEYYHDNPPAGGTVITQPQASTVVVNTTAGGYYPGPGQQYIQQQPPPQPAPQQPYGAQPPPQPPYGAQPYQQGAYQQHPAPYGAPVSNVQHVGGAELPPPYEEFPQSMPSAPPAEKQ